MTYNLHFSSASSFLDCKLPWGGIIFPAASKTSSRRCICHLLPRDRNTCTPRWWWQNVQANRTGQYSAGSSHNWQERGKTQIFKSHFDDTSASHSCKHHWGAVMNQGQAGPPTRAQQWWECCRAGISFLGMPLSTLMEQAQTTPQKSMPQKIHT